MAKSPVSGNRFDLHAVTFWINEIDIFDHDNFSICYRDKRYQQHLWLNANIMWCNWENPITLISQRLCTHTRACSAHVRASLIGCSVETHTLIGRKRTNNVKVFFLFRLALWSFPGLSALPCRTWCQLLRSPREGRPYLHNRATIFCAENVN